MKERWNNPFVRSLGILIVLLVLLVGSMQLIYATRALPGVYVGSLSVAGQSKADIADQLNRKTAALRTLTFRYDGRSFDVPADAVGLKIDPDATAAAALAAGRNGGLDEALTPSRLGFAKLDVGVRYQLNRDALKQKLVELTKGVGTPAQDAAIKRTGTDFSIVPEHAGRDLNLDQAVRDARYQIQRFDNQVTLVMQPQQPQVRARSLASAKAAAERMASQPLKIQAGDRTLTVTPSRLASWVAFERKDRSADSSLLADATLVPRVAAALSVAPTELPLPSLRDSTLQVGIDRTAVGQYVPELANAVDRPPVNARLSFTNGQLTVSGQAQDGLVVDRPAAVTELAAAAVGSHDATVRVVAKPADIRQETLPTLGITTLIGSATTTFAGSPANRTYNIGVGAAKFNGALIKPGEEFSFNKQLGDVGPETGYVQELVIKDNKTTPEFGGGLCQVSTTMFRAALAAGLPITARTNHFYAVHYYAPIGMDATIYPPYPDLKFVNNTPHYILVQTSQVGTSLTYQFFGTDDGRKAHTEMLYSNATEQNGGTAAFRYVVEGGAKPINQVFSSTYKPQKDFPLPGQKSLN